jgi:hypothetical protein
MGAANQEFSRCVRDVIQMSMVKRRSLLHEWISAQEANRFDGEGYDGESQTRHQRVNTTM